MWSRNYLFFTKSLSTINSTWVLFFFLNPTKHLVLINSCQGVFFFQFCHVAHNSNHRQEEFRAISWQQVREDSTHFVESCYVLATPKDPVSKYGDFHVFLLRMWWTKRHLKLILLKRIYKCWVDEKFGTKKFGWCLHLQDSFNQFQVLFFIQIRYLAVMGLIDDFRIQLKNHTITKFIHQISLILV